jgi:hypothetical protein
MRFVRFICCGIYPSKKVERFPAWKAIQDTDEPSSDRLIQEGRTHMRRLSFFSRFRDRFPRRLNCPLSTPEARFPHGFLKESRYWLKKHRLDMPVDSQGPFDYFVFVIGLENP